MTVKWFFVLEVVFKSFFSFVFAVAVTRRLRLMLHLGRVPQAIAGSVPTHGVLALPGHRIFSKAGAAC